MGKNLEKYRKHAPKTPKGLPNDIKICPGTGLFHFWVHLHFERPYGRLARNSCLRGVKVDTETFEKPSQQTTLKKNHSNTGPDQLFWKSWPMLAKMAPTRLPKAHTKSLKTYTLLNICIFTCLDTPFYVLMGVWGYPLAAKTTTFSKITFKNTSVKTRQI